MKETQIASDALSGALRNINSKFNVIGFGDDFNVGILNDLVKSGSEQGIVGIVSKDMTSEDLKGIFSEMIYSQ